MPKKLKYNLKPLNMGNETIGERIARFRKQNGLTQMMLAEKIGITQTLVSDYECSRTRLADDMVIRFALALNVSADEILGLKSSGMNDYAPSLRFIKRIKELEHLPKQKQKAILQSLDMMIAAAQAEQQKK